MVALSSARGMPLKVESERPNVATGGTTFHIGSELRPKSKTSRRAVSVHPPGDNSCLIWNIEPFDAHMSC